MGPRVPLEDRKLIVSLSDEGISQREICRRTGRSMSAVNRIIQAYKYDNGRLVDADRPGRPRSTDDTKDTLIAAAVVADPSLSARDVQKSLSLKVSCVTIRRRLRDAGFCNHVAVPRPHLTDRERQQRLDFARDVEHWTPDEWREVVFTGQSSFCARWDQQRRAWGPVNTRYLLQGEVPSGRCAVDVWGSLSKDGLGPLIRVEVCLTPSKYCDILQETLLPYVLNGPFPDGCYLLQHNGTVVHTAPAVRALLEDNAVRELEWPENGLDLNPIENVWAFLKERLVEKDLCGADADSLWAAISAEWGALRARPEVVSLLYHSMPLRMAQLIETDGNFTGY